MDFERQYYEDESFWIDSLTDPKNTDRIRRTATLIPADVQSLVDIGCGNGVFLNYLRRENKNLSLLGIDRSKVALSFVQTERMEATIDQIPLADCSFDCVSCLEVIEHLPIGIYEMALRELTRVARKHVIISVPYKEDLVQSFNRCPSCKSTFSYEMHLRSFDDEAMKGLLDPFGFRFVRSEYMGASESFVGHDFYKKYFYPELSRKFIAPICPVCGFKNVRKIEAKDGVLSVTEGPIGAKQRVLSMLSAIPKLVWPRKMGYYWIVAVYSKA